MHTLSNYNDTGILIVTPESDLSADRQALNANFKTVVTTFVPYTGATGDVNLGSHSLTVAGGAISLGPDVVPPNIDGTLGIQFANDYLSAIIPGSDGQILELTTNEDGADISRNPAFPGVKIQADSRGGTGRFKVYTQNPGSDPTENCPLAVDDTDAVNMTGSDAVSDGAAVLNVDSQGRAFAIRVTGASNLDGGAITTDGVGTLCLHPQTSPPARVAGGIYFDGTYFYVCKDGSTWTTLI